MISFTCDNCGVVAEAVSGAMPLGWYSFMLNVIAPPTVPVEGEPPPPPTPPTSMQAHAHNQACYEALIGGLTTFAAKKRKG